ncbi:transmembrane protein 100-like [Scophthalmus maximus]|uniref:Transmembrane protein 100-like n=1 Tax=Scophthalmus maximus TaxID=52904 RepID=A0A8D3AM85_SCOMX|nr:transmembrane protein 100-like [Scophthalmus maximus]
MTTKMEILDPSTLSDTASAVTYNSKSETLTLPGGLTSVAGITVVTGGAELSCGTCMLAFCFWKTLIGFSCVAVGLWDQLNHTRKGTTSHLLGLGLVILALSFVVVGSIVAYELLTRKKREMTREQREDGKEVLVESGRVIKKVTV